MSRRRPLRRSPEPDARPPARGEPRLARLDRGVPEGYRAAHRCALPRRRPGLPPGERAAAQAAAEPEGDGEDGDQEDSADDQS